MQKAGIKPGIPRQNAADNGGPVYIHPTNSSATLRTLTPAQQRALVLKNMSLNPALFR